jgi:hypothetical protein
MSRERLHDLSLALALGVAKGQEVVRVTPEGNSTAIAFSPAGKYLVTAGMSGGRVWL